MNSLLKITFSVFIIILFACCNSSADNSDKIGFDTMSEADSLKVVANLFASLENEIYENVFLPVNKDTTRIVDNYGCGLRSIMNIRMNSRNQIMISNTIGAPITQSIIDYYSANIKQNDPTNWFPMYSRISKSQIETELQKAKESAQETEKAEGADPELIKFKLIIVEEWEKRLIAIQTLGKGFLPEPHSQSVIKLHYFPEIVGQSSIIDSVLLAFYELRDRASESYFKTSYLEIFERYSRTKKEKDKNRLLTLQILHPIRVTDQPNLKKYNLIIVDDPFDGPPTQTLNIKDDSREIILNQK